MSGEDQTVYVIDTGTRSVTANIPVGVYSSEIQPMVVDPVTHLVYPATHHVYVTNCKPDGSVEVLARQ
ncbi:hypothetical protein [Nocardia xishanensis]